MQHHIAVAENAADQTIVYGIGATEAEALADAQRFADADDERTRFVALPCTERLHDHVREHGGAGLRWEENADGLQDLPAHEDADGETAEDGIYDDEACTIRLEDDAELPSIFYRLSAGTLTRYWYTQPYTYDVHEFREDAHERGFWYGLGSEMIDDDTTVAELLESEGA